MFLVTNKSCLPPGNSFHSRSRIPATVPLRRRPGFSPVASTSLTTPPTLSPLTPAGRPELPPLAKLGLEGWAPPTISGTSSENKNRDQSSPLILDA